MPGLQRADGFFPQNAMLSTFTLILVMLWGADFVRSRKFLRGLLLLAAPIAWPYFAIYLLAPLLGRHQGILGLLFYTVLPSTSVILDGSLYFITGRRAAVRPARPPRRAGRGVVRLDAAH